MQKRARTALVASGPALPGSLVSPTTAGASPTSVTKIGAWTQYGNWTAFDAAVGPVDVDRGYAGAGRVSATGVSRPALWVSYWNSTGGRADWGLRFQHPVPSESDDSPAFRTWRDLAAQP